MLIKQIEAYAQEMGIDVIGFTHNIKLAEYQQHLQAKKDHHKLYVRHGEISEYDNTNLLLSNTKTIISIGIRYHNDYPYFQGQYGYISKASYGEDYHRQLNDLGAKLVAYIKEDDPNLNSKVLCDTSILDDRYYAYLAGNGFYGKNSMVINEKYGSMVFYATILLDVDLDFVQPPLIANQCGSCNLCEQSCPTNSLVNQELDYRTCLSHLTQTRSMIALDKLNHRLYGCDNCNNACPYNREVSHSTLFNETKGFYDLLAIINASKAEYNTMFKDHSLLWLNYNIIKKNAILNLAYYWVDNQKEIMALYDEVKKRKASPLLEEAFHYLFDKLEVNLDEV